MTRRGRIIGAALTAAAALLGAPLPAGLAGNPFNEVEQTPHNIMPPSSSYTLKELCLVCHVDGKISLPGLPQPPEEEELPAFVTEREQRPAWEPGTAVKNFTLPQNWPVPEHLSPDRPFGSSADCLGCHDGAFAEDVHRGDGRMDDFSCVPLCKLFDRLEAALGTNPNRKSAIPDHPISMIYPRMPDGRLQFKEPTTGQRRYFAIADLQDDQLVLPTGATSKFYAGTPGSPQAVAPAIGQGNGGQNGNGARSAAASSGVGGGAGEPDPAESFRLVHTTFGVIHCDSCHNAHSELHAGFLRDKSPQLCLLCHDR